MARRNSSGRCPCRRLVWLIACVQVATSAHMVDLRILICEQVGLKDYNKLAIRFAGHIISEDHATVHEIGLCDQAIVKCDPATQQQQQAMKDLSKASTQLSWEAWAGIEPRTDKKLHRPHSMMGGSTGLAPDKPVAQVELDVIMKSDEVV